MAQENLLVTEISREKTNHIHWFIALEEIVNKNVFLIKVGDFNKPEFMCMEVHIQSETGMVTNLRYANAR